MKYYVEIKGREHEVILDADGALLDGRRVTTDLEGGRGTHLWHLLMDGRSHRVRARRLDRKGVWEIELDGVRHRVVTLNERARAIRDLTGSTSAAFGPFDVVAPMPGLVIDVQVKADDMVSSGQGLIIIEAMKMENELKAQTAGQVKEVRVAAGQAVNRGETLVVIEPAGPE